MIGCPARVHENDRYRIHDAAPAAPLTVVSHSTFGVREFVLRYAGELLRAVGGVLGKRPEAVMANSSVCGQIDAPYAAIPRSRFRITGKGAGS